jgi:hypothetical protein
MLTINLEQIISDINSRRNRVRYPFQELALMLTEKLNDTRHKSLYMKIAKYEEQELVMDALHYVTAGNLSGNLGAIFMWKLKELKARPLFPLTLRFECSGGYFKVGSISEAVRGDMPIIVAVLTDYSQSNVLELTFPSLIKKSENTLDIKDVPFISLITMLTSTLKDFKRAVRLSLFTEWSWHPTVNEVMPTENIQGVLKVGNPLLTKREFVEKKVVHFTRKGIPSKKSPGFRQSN